MSICLCFCCETHASWPIFSYNCSVCHSVCLSFCLSSLSPSLHWHNAGTRWAGYRCAWHLGCRTSPPDPLTYAPQTKAPPPLGWTGDGVTRATPGTSLVFNTCVFSLQMPWKYVSKGKRGLWTEQRMRMAVANVITNGVSVKRSATTHNFPRLTLRRHVLSHKSYWVSSDKEVGPSINFILWARRTDTANQGHGEPYVWFESRWHSTAGVSLLRTEQHSTQFQQENEVSWPQLVRGLSPSSPGFSKLHTWTNFCPQSYRIQCC